MRLDIAEIHVAVSHEVQVAAQLACKAQNMHVTEAQVRKILRQWAVDGLVLCASKAYEKHRKAKLQESEN